MTTIKQGRPGTYGIAVASEKLESRAEVIGNLEDMTAVVNGVQAKLPRARVKMDVMSLERNLKIVNGAEKECRYGLFDFEYTHQCQGTQEVMKFFCLFFFLFLLIICFFSFVFFFFLCFLFLCK